MKVNKNGKVILTIDKPVPEDWNVKDVVDSINKSKVQTVSALSHELKHEYTLLINKCTLVVSSIC